MALMGRWLILGATGLFGQAAMQEAKRRGIEALGAARTSADIDLDITDAKAVWKTLHDFRPEVVLNSAALIEIGACEADPELAHRVNADAVEALAAATESLNTRFVQISTDHYWTGDGAQQHDEDAPVSLVNEYAKSKYAGELAALKYKGSLVVRTNVTGFRGWTDRPTFAEWCMDVIEEDRPVTLFTDFYTSTIDAPGLARAVFDLVERGATGLFHVASSEVLSKAEFIRGLAEVAGRPLTLAREGSVAGLVPRRAESLGLDVDKAEKALGYELPGASEVWQSLVQQSEENQCVTRQA